MGATHMLQADWNPARLFVFLSKRALLCYSASLSSGFQRLSEGASAPSEAWRFLAGCTSLWRQAQPATPTEWCKKKCRYRLKDLFRELNAKLRGYYYYSSAQVSPWMSP